MPKEAAVAAKYKYPELERMLLSPTETRVSLNLTNAGRKQVHDMIRDHMEYGKLSHDSEGSGRARVLSIDRLMTQADCMHVRTSIGAKDLFLWSHKDSATSPQATIAHNHCVADTQSPQVCGSQ